MNLTEAGKRIQEAKSKKLHTLDLSGCRELNAETFRQLKLHELAEHLTELNVNNCNLGTEGAVTISKALPNLTQLDISNNNIGERGASAIAQNLHNLTQLNISDNNIGDDGASAIAQNLHNLAQLNISYNKIGEGGATAIAQNLHNLTQLDIRDNNIGEGGATAIAQNLHNLTQLDIRNNNIEDRGASAIAQNLHNLTQLYISYNNIADGGASAIAQKLHNLTQLDISRNEIGDGGASAIAQKLHNLTQLYISDNNIADGGASAIAQKLHNLTQLYIRENNIGEGGATAIAQKLHNLTQLDISNNNIGERGASAIAQKLHNLTQLYISNNKIGEGGTTAIAQNLHNLTQLDISRNEIGDGGASAIAQNLHNLTQLDISFNNIGEGGATAIAQKLYNLTQLYISDNNIGDGGATAIAQNLHNLAQLDISFNNIGDGGATAIAQNLHNLAQLDISFNNIGDGGLKALALVPSLKHTYIFIIGNEPQSIPRETAININTLRAYFNAGYQVELIKGNVVRLVLCGNTRAGKTSLATKLKDVNLPNPKEEDRTHGIRHWSLKKTVNRKDYYLNIWDFGGQDYYHATHTASLSATDKEKDNLLTLYLLVWRHKKPPVRLGYDEDAHQQFGEDYWLGFIHLLAGSPSLTMLQTHTDEDAPAFPDSWQMHQEQLALTPASFRQLCLKDEYILTEDGKAKWGIFYDHLIASAIQKIDTSAEKIPTTWQQLREEFIPQLTKKHTTISRKELEELLLSAPQLQQYADIPAALGYIGLLSYLKGCGDILCWNDQQHPLHETIVLNIERFHREMYEILLTSDARKEGGILRTTSGYEFHISYLLQHELIFEKQEMPGTYVAPQYLPVQPLITHFKQLIPRTLILRFPHYMPRYLITRCIVQVYRQNPGDTDYWKYGCISAWQQGDTPTHFMVAINPDTKNHDVLFYIKDTPGKFELLRRLYGFFASFGTQDIWPEATEKHPMDSQQKLMALPDKEIAEERRRNQIPEDITDALQLSTDGEHFVEVQEIKKAIKDKQYSVRTIDNRYTNLNTTMQQLVNPNARPPKKIFFSYSRYDRKYRDEFDVHFEPLRRLGRVSTWFDGMIEPGQDANEHILKQLTEADIIICLLSPNFMANNYIWNIEMEKAKKMNKVIILVTLRKCDYKEYFSDFFASDKQGFLTQKQYDVEQLEATRKRDEIWIASEQHDAKRDEYYGFIVDELKKTLDK